MLYEPCDHWVLLGNLNAGHGLDHVLESPGQSVDGLDGVLHLAV